MGVSWKLRIAITGSVAAACLGTAGCGSDPVTAPMTVTGARLVPQGSTLDPKALRQWRSRSQGCAFSMRASDGMVHTAILRSQELPFRLPTVLARIDGSPPARTLRVWIPIHGSDVKILAMCVVPKDFTSADLVASVTASTDSKSNARWVKGWQTIYERIRQPAGQSKPGEHLRTPEAAQVEREMLGYNRHGVTQLVRAAGAGVSGDVLVPVRGIDVSRMVASDPGCQPGEVGACCDSDTNDCSSGGTPQPIQTVYVTAPENPPIIIIVDPDPADPPPIWLTPQPGDGDFYGGGGIPDSDAGPGYSAYIECDDIPYQAPSEPTIDDVSSSATCPPGAANICIDLFIQDTAVKISGLGLKGDGRVSDPEAQPAMSRAQIVIPLDTTISPYYTVSPSCFVVDYAVLDGPRQTATTCYKPLPADTATTLATKSPYTNLVIVGRNGNTIAVTFSLANSVMQVPRISSIGPSIDGTITLVKQSDGSWSTSGTRNAFPTMDIWQWQNGVHTLLAHGDQTGPLALIDVLHQSQSWCSGSN